MSLKNIAKLVKQATAKDMTPANEFENFLNQAIVMQEKKNIRPPSKTYKPSSLGGCWRKIYFEVEGAQIDANQTVDPSFVGICESGTDRHERLQQAVIAMKDLKINCEWVDVEEYLKLYPQPGTRIIERKGNEFKLRNDILNMSFMCDGIVKFGGKYYILEIKTEVSFKWNGRKAAEDDHQIQASSYSTCLGISDVLFIYEQRDVCSKKYYHVNVTDEDREIKVVHIINMIEEHRRQGTVPDKSENKVHCNYCQFKEECVKW